MGHGAVSLKPWIEQELLQTTRDFHSCKQEEWQSISSYVLKMKGYIDNLERLGYPVILGLGVSLILIGLRKEFDGFIHNYNMHSMGKTVDEFHAMLKLHEQTLTLPKNNAPALYVIRAGKGLRVSRKLKMGALSLYVGNGQRKAVEAIGVFYLCLPSGLEIILNNCHFTPSITKGVISVSRLYEDGFINHFVNNTIQVSRNNMVYFSAIPRDGIFKIDLYNSYANESSIYTVSNKRAKLDLDSALLWHCRLGHICKKRIENWQHDGLLNSIDLKAFEKCVPCMSGKMARKPYTHQVERAKNLLGLIHTDVCGPFKIMSRQGSSYFVTFTDEFSSYGYVYLLKHKHDVFETFKVFQKEVENQLGSWDYRPSYSSLHAITQWCVEEEKPNPTRYGSIHDESKTLPKSFWDYALETAARILNMVPTKKVEKTPYEEHELGDLVQKDNEVWDLVDLPPNGKTVGSKWLFKKKTDMDGAVHTYKARLVAKGYTQTPGIDYDETFSPIADIRAIRILIAIAAF
ncbi:retrotransposon protein, putative, ty1-copia subclass [Tanacetum coccineum]